MPARETYQGYQRSGALLFNNINSQDTNAFQNNQTYFTQTMGQVPPDSSFKTLQRFQNSFEKINPLTTQFSSNQVGSPSNDYQDTERQSYRNIFAEITRSKESIQAQQNLRKTSCTQIAPTGSKLDPYQQWRVLKDVHSKESLERSLSNERTARV